MNDAQIEYILTRDQINALWAQIANLQVNVAKLTATNEQLQAENARLRAIVAPLIAAWKQATPGLWYAAYCGAGDKSYEIDGIFCDDDGKTTVIISGNMAEITTSFILTARAVADALAAEQAELVERLR